MLELLSNQGIRFVVEVFLARLLMPSDFGLIGMIAIFLAISQVFIDSGFNSALVRDPNPTKKQYSTVFYFNLLVSVVIYVAIYFSAEIISSFYQEPRLVNILRVLSIIVMINAFGLVQTTILTKKIDFKTQTKISILASLISGGIGIGFAFLGFGVWSLVFRNLINQLLRAVLLCLHNRWLPVFGFDLRYFKVMFRFGWKLLVSRILGAAYQNIYNLIIGRIYSATDLGLYTKSINLNGLVSTTIHSAIGRVSYPVLCSVNNEPTRLKKFAQRILKMSFFFSCPIMGFMIISADSLVFVFLGEKWVEMVPYFRILCLAGVTYPSRAVNLNILKVVGRTDLLLKAELLNISLGLLVIGVVVALGLGIYGLVWSVVFTAMIGFVINALISGGKIGYPLLEQIKDCLPFLSLTIVVCAVGYVLGFLTKNPYFQLMLQTTFCIPFYLFAGRILRFQEYRDAFDIIRQKIKNKSPK